MENLDIQETLFSRVVTILEEARKSTVRAVNGNMILAYWLIGREIVQELQGGQDRAGYGENVIKELSIKLQGRYKKGFSTTNLWYFRQFYQVFSNRIQILHPAGGESGDEVQHSEKEATGELILHLTGGELVNGFKPDLTWSHYRALMQVTSLEARLFYEKEAVECGWNKVQLERQIQSSYYERIVDKNGKAGLVATNRERLPGERVDSIHLLKSPYILEFLDLPDSAVLHENDIEQAIINNLQSFLLELGKGFSFVGRQKHIRFGDDDFYVDLVFYNYILKCFVLIDLKIGKLTHADVGQMDGYVRLFEDRFKNPDDNPTIGLILCSDKSEAVARYSVLTESKQIFASKYLKFLPSEEELRIEIEKERRLIELKFAENA